MLRRAFACIFIALPLLEIALLIKTGQLIGFWPTLAIVVGTGIVGAHVLLHQSWAVVRRTREVLAQGRPPVAPVLDGVFLLLAGALLLTPGLLSDTVALLLLIPPVRRGVARWGVRRLVRQTLGREQTHAGSGGGRPGSRPSRPKTDAPIIEGEFERLSEKTTGPHRGNDRNRL